MSMSGCTHAACSFTACCYLLSTLTGRLAAKHVLGLLNLFRVQAQQLLLWKCFLQGFNFQINKASISNCFIQRGHDSFSLGVLLNPLGQSACDLRSRDLWWKFFQPVSASPYSQTHQHLVQYRSVVWISIGLYSGTMSARVVCRLLTAAVTLGSHRIWQ